MLVALSVLALVQPTQTVFVTYQKGYNLNYIFINIRPPLAEEVLFLVAVLVNSILVARSDLRYKDWLSIISPFAILFSFGMLGLTFIGPGKIGPENRVELDSILLCTFALAFVTPLFTIINATVGFSVMALKEFSKPRANPIIIPEQKQTYFSSCITSVWFSVLTLQVMTSFVVGLGVVSDIINIGSTGGHGLFPAYYLLLPFRFSTFCAICYFVVNFILTKLGKI